MINGQSISQVARQTGFTPATLRYYDEIDLLRPARSVAGYRRYSDEDLERLAFIGRAKRLGLSLDQIQRLTDGWHRDDCRSTRARLADSVEARIADVQDLIADLVAFRDRLRAARDDLARQPVPSRCSPGCGCDVDVAPIDLATGQRISLVAAARPQMAASIDLRSQRSQPASPSLPNRRPSRGHRQRPLHRQ